MAWMVYLKFTDIYQHPVADISWSYQETIPAKRIAIERGIDD